MKHLIFAVAIAAMTTGCVTRVLDLTTASTKNMPLDTTYRVDKTKRVTGESIMHHVILPFGQFSIKEAMDKAIESAPGAIALSDVVVDYTFWTTIIYGQQYYTVEGNPVYPAEKK